MNENNSKNRTLDDINEILALAKLNENDLLPVSQTIYFTSNNVHNNNLRFLELDKHLSECLKEGQNLFIKGGDDDTAVICTKSHTYNVIETETSNSLLLSHSLKLYNELENTKDRTVSTVEIYGIFNTYLAVVPGRPNTKALKAILNSTVYRGPEYESEITNPIYTFQELLDNVQMAEDELKVALKELYCFTIGDTVRLLDFQYHFIVLTFMLNFVEENSWDLDKVDYEETRNQLSDLVLPEILDTLFDYYAEETHCIDGTQLYQYNESKVCRFFAMVLLSRAGKFNLEEFLTTWGESVPLGMVVTEDMLHGVAIMDRMSVPPVIHEFKEESLPDNITDRLKILFEAKQKWTLKEISPYIQRLTSTTMDASALLAKHARASTVQGEKYYSSKHGR